jgi:predicted enzyme related to lactoylglutathione lyase
MSPDVDASKAFYTAVFGWEADDRFDDDGNRVYVMFSLGGKSVAGLGGQPPGMGDMPAVWNSYVATDDVAATAARVMEAGGTVMMPPMQVMEAGEMAIFADPTGAAFSVWKANEHIGAELCNEPNTWAWNELMTRDLDAALPFYSAVFGWSYDPQDMGPMGTYHVIQGGEHGGLGGLMAMPPDVPDMVPNHWAVYFTVADIEASIDAVRANGGQVVVEPMDIPGVGTTATVHDPAGGNFSLMQPADA